MKEYNKTYWLENKEKILDLRRTKYNKSIKNYYLQNKNNLLEKAREYYYRKNYDIPSSKKEMIITNNITLYFN